MILPVTELTRVAPDEQLVEVQRLALDTRRQPFDLYGALARSVTWWRLPLVDAYNAGARWQRGSQRNGALARSVTWWFLPLMDAYNAGH